VKRAIAFVEANDPNLWATLIRHALRDPALLADLLDDAGAHSLDLTALLRAIPDRTEIPGLRDKLLGIFRERRCDAAIARAALDCAKGDSLALTRKLYHLKQRGIRCDPPHERDADGNIVIRAPPRFY
jgi:hypothetical protein